MERVTPNSPIHRYFEGKDGVGVGGGGTPGKRRQVGGGGVRSVMEQGFLHLVEYLLARMRGNRYNSKYGQRIWSLADPKPNPCSDKAGPLLLSACGAALSTWKENMGKGGGGDVSAVLHEAEEHNACYTGDKSPALRAERSRPQASANIGKTRVSTGRVYSTVDLQQASVFPSWLSAAASRPGLEGTLKSSGLLDRSSVFSGLRSECDGSACRRILLMSTKSTCGCKV